MAPEKVQPDIFKEITGTLECEGILQRAATFNSNLQIKIGDDALIVLKTVAYQNGSLLAEYVAGIDPISSEVDIVFEAEKQWYCGTAVLSAKSAMDHPVYSLSISKLFEIQRREVFRVTIKNDVIKASFDLSNGKSFTVTEISEKGFALAIPLEEALTLHQGSEYRGNLVVQPHAAIDLSVKIVRIMETNGEMKAGCEIVSGTQAIHQKVASLVTECHRILFAKMT